MSTKRVSTEPACRTEIRHYEIGTERPITYPSTWFEKEGNTKPVIIILPDKNITRKQIHATVLRDFGTGRFDHKIAVKFLQMEFCRHPGSPNEDWSSFNRVICKQGVAMILANLVVFNEIEEAPPLKAAGELMPMDEIVKYIKAICTLYRLAQISRQEYRDQVTDNVDKVLATLGGTS